MPGETLQVVIDLSFPTAHFDFRYSRTTQVAVDGRASVRVPYATEPENPDIHVQAARWSIGTRSGELHVSEEDVRAGNTVQLR